MKSIIERLKPPPLLAGMLSFLGVALVSSTAFAAGPELLVAEFSLDGLNDFLDSDMGNITIRIGGAIAILIAGWFVAKVLSWIVFRALCATELDDKLAAKLRLNYLLTKEQTDQNAIERFAARVVYYILMLMVVVAALQYTELTQVAAPIEGLLSSLFQAVPLIAKASLILLAAWGIATILKTVLSRLLVPVDTRFAELTETTDGEESHAFSHGIANVVFWLIMVFGLVGALDALQIDALSAPFSSAIDSLIAMLPAIAKAALIVLAGYALGRIARTIVTNLASSIGVDKAVSKLKLERVFEKKQPSEILGILIFAFIMIQVSVAGLNAVGLETISGPLTAMLSQFWLLVPNVLVAALIVIVGVVVGRLARGLVEGVLKSLGFDDIMEKLGFGEIANRNEKLDEPSEFVGMLVMVGIIMLASAQALETLGLATWALYLNTFLGYILKNVSVAVIVILVGFAVGNYVRDIIAGSGENDESRQWVGALARYAVLVFAFTMAIHQLDVAQDFVLIAFALLFGSLCLALALAFGLGSRGVAEEIVSRQYERARERFADDAAPAAVGGGLKLKAAKKPALKKKKEDES